MSSVPQCYRCKFRGEIPGSCHSKCTHKALSDPHNFVLSVKDPRSIAEPLGLKLNQTGIG